jgi:hypothetical protein
MIRKEFGMEKNGYLTENTFPHTFMPTTAHSQQKINSQQEIHGRKLQLNQESHMGMVIGAILALFIGYHLNSTGLNAMLLLSLPVILTYLLRKIYIHTLVYAEHDI